MQTAPQGGVAHKGARALWCHCGLDGRLREHLSSQQGPPGWAHTHKGHLERLPEASLGGAAVGLREEGKGFQAERERESGARWPEETIWNITLEPQCRHL